MVDGLIGPPGHHVTILAMEAGSSLIAVVIIQHLEMVGCRAMVLLQQERSVISIFAEVLYVILNVDDDVFVI